MAHHIPRFLLPRGPLLARDCFEILRPNIVTARSMSSTCVRRATTAPPSKPRVLEKPTRFNPPSHGRRLKEHIPRSYGPELTPEQKVTQKTKKYPNMFPPEGSFMFWFLTNRGIHLWITMGTLVLLASFTAFENWRKDSPFKEQLPARKDVLMHPIDSIWHVFALVKANTYENSLKVDAKRKTNVHDIQKRNTYRKYHGIEDKQGLGPWMPVEEKMRLYEGQPAGAKVQHQGENQDEVVTDFEGKQKPIKKWLGIW